MEGRWHEGVTKVVKQVRVLDCQVWAAEKEAPLGGISRGGLGGGGAATGSYRGGCEDWGVVLESGVTKERPPPGQSSVRNDERVCEEVGAGRGRRRGRE